MKFHNRGYAIELESESVIEESCLKFVCLFIATTTIQSWTKPDLSSANHTAALTHGVFNLMATKSQIGYTV